MLKILLVHEQQYSAVAVTTTWIIQWNGRSRWLNCVYYEYT